MIARYGENFDGASKMLPFPSLVCQGPGKFKRVREQLGCGQVPNSKTKGFVSKDKIAQYLNKVEKQIRNSTYCHESCTRRGQTS